MPRIKKPKFQIDPTLQLKLARERCTYEPELGFKVGDRVRISCADFKGTVVGFYRSALVIVQIDSEYDFKCDYWGKGAFASSEPDLEVLCQG